MTSSNSGEFIRREEAEDVESLFEEIDLIQPLPIGPAVRAELRTAPGSTTTAALPNDVPPPPSLAEVPPDVLHTGTVETLIGHVEDITARLKVALRQNSVYDGQILTLKRTQQELEASLQASRSHLSVYIEKDRNLRDRFDAYDERVSGLLKQLEEAKIRISTLERIEAAWGGELARLRAYRRRILRWVRSSSELRREKLSVLMREKIAAEEAALAARAALGDARRDLAVLREQAIHHEQAMTRDRARLVDHYEQALDALQNEADHLREDLKRSSVEREALSRTSDEAIRSRNRILALERGAVEYQKKVEEELREWKERYETSHRECEILRGRLAQSKDGISASNNRESDLERERSVLAQQIDSLRIVWHETQMRLERSEQRAQALEKLNATLTQEVKTLKAAGS